MHQKQKCDFLKVSRALPVSVCMCLCEWVGLDTIWAGQDGWVGGLMVGCGQFEVFLVH